MRFANQIVDILKLDSIKDRKWMIVACSAVTKEGLSEGLDWIIENVQANKTSI